MDVYYLNSLGIKVNLSRWPYQIKSWNPQNYAWDYEYTEADVGGNISRFQRALKESEITVAVHSNHKERRAKDVNALFEAVETDVLAKTPGKLFLNGQYLLCYFIANEKAIEGSIKNTMTVKFKIVSEYPFWCKDEIFHFKANPTDRMMNRDKPSTDDTDHAEYRRSFPFDFPFDLKSEYRRTAKYPLFKFPFDFNKNMTAVKLINEHYSSCDFKMIIYGSCREPSIWVDDHLYQVKISLFDGEYLVVDSRKKTVIKYGNNGVTTNCFNFRNKESHLFEKISSGYHQVKWNMLFGFDLILFKERSEPLWTS